MRQTEEVGEGPPAASLFQFPVALLLQENTGNHPKEVAGVYDEMYSNRMTDCMLDCRHQPGNLAAAEISKHKPRLPSQLKDTVSSMLLSVPID
jgi:hypothetical protein